MPSNKYFPGDLRSLSIASCFKIEVATYTTHKVLCIVSTPLSLTSIYNSDLLPKKVIEAIQYFPYAIHRGWQSSIKWCLQKPCESKCHRVSNGTNISETWKVNFRGKSQSSASFRLLRSKSCPSGKRLGRLKALLFFSVTCFPPPRPHFHSWTLCLSHF